MASPLTSLPPLRPSITGDLTITDNLQLTSVDISPVKSVGGAIDA